MKAQVTIHEWSDFQCPFCGRVEPTVQEMMKDYGEKVKFVWHDLPLPMHPKAPLAAEAAREA
jgi:protein-disulfide isomerase